MSPVLEQTWSSDSALVPQKIIRRTADRRWGGGGVDPVIGEGAPILTACGRSQTALRFGCVVKEQDAGARC